MHTDPFLHKQDKPESASMINYCQLFFSFSVFLLLSIKPALPQPAYLDSAFSANEHIYAFEFESADSSIKRLNDCHPKDYIPALLSANYYWWLIITGHDTTENRQKYYARLDDALQKLQAEIKENRSNDSLYSLITAFAYKARIHSMNNQYFSALSQLNHCIDFVKQSFGREKDYEWFRLTTGLYNYYIEAVKKNYPFLIPYLIFLPEGNSTTGIEYLQQAAASGNSLLRTEARYFLMKIYLEEEKKFSLSRGYSSALIKKYPYNLLFRYYQFKSFLEEGLPEDAARELGLLRYYAEKNAQLSEMQKAHFQNIAREDLKEYYKGKN